MMNENNISLEKVINGLQEAVDWLSTETCLTVVDQWVVRDALALLKAQEQSQRDYEAAVEMEQCCEHYEPTYNPEDGSL